MVITCYAQEIAPVATAHRTARSTHDASRSGSARQMRSHSAIGFRPAGRVPERSHTRAITPRDGQHKYSGLPASVGSAQQLQNSSSKEESRPQLSQCGTPHRYECHKRSLFCRRSRRCDVFEPPSGSKSVRSAAGPGARRRAGLLVALRSRAIRPSSSSCHASSRPTARSDSQQLADLTRVSRSCSSRARPAAGGCAREARRSAGATG